MAKVGDHRGDGAIWVRWRAFGRAAGDAPRADGRTAVFGGPRLAKVGQAPKGPRRESASPAPRRISMQAGENANPSHDVVTVRNSSQRDAVTVSQDAPPAASPRRAQNVLAAAKGEALSRVTGLPGT